LTGSLTYVNVVHMSIELLDIKLHLYHAGYVNKPHRPTQPLILCGYKFN